jgi:tetratricopeptide (TPR) repeat protein
MARRNWACGSRVRWGGSGTPVATSVRGASGSNDCLSWTQDAPPGLQAKAFYWAGAMAWRQGDYEAAIGLLTQSLALARELGDPRGIARALLALGHARLVQEDYEQAKGLYEESLATFQALHDKRGEAISLSSLGILELEHGRYSRAESLLEESLALRRDLADPQGIASALDDLGRVALRQGDGEHAQDLLRESLRVYQDLGDTLGIADSLDGLAQALQAQGRSVDAARLGGAAEATREAAGASRRDTDRVEHDRMLEAIKAAIGDEGFWREWALGRAMPIDAAMALALEEAPGDLPPGRRDSHDQPPREAADD